MTRTRGDKPEVELVGGATLDGSVIVEKAEAASLGTHVARCRVVDASGSVNPIAVAVEQQVDDNVMVPATDLDEVYAAGGGNLVLIINDPILHEQILKATKERDEFEEVSDEASDILLC